MSWFKSDDGLPDHPKVLALAETRQYKGSMALWLLAGCWASKQLTDGHVPKAVVKRLGFSAADARGLVEHGLWNVAEDGGYQFNDWTDYNPTAADVTAKRKATADRVKRHRNGDGNASGNGVGNALHGGGSNALETHPRPVPSRPVPSRPDQDTGVSSGRDPEFWVQVGKLWAERYNKAKAVQVPIGDHRKAFESIAYQCGGDLGKVRTSLENYWRDDWATDNHWPPGVWAKQFGRHLDGPAQSRSPEAIEAARVAERQAQIARIDAEILGGSR